MAEYYSMTGYGSWEKNTKKLKVTIELKSVNHKYVDIKLRTPPSLFPLELNIRNSLKENLARGSVDCSIKLQHTSYEHLKNRFNHSKISEHLKFVEKLAKENGANFTLHTNDFFNSEFMEKDLPLDQKDSDLILKGLNQAIKAILKSRKDEGKKLIDKINTFLNIFQKALGQIKKEIDKEPKIKEDKILTNLKNKELDKNVDSNRFAQELVYYLEKSNAEEELTRINIHLEHLKKTISKGGSIGRKIEFLIQELNRETNTLSAKVSLPSASGKIVDMKLQLDKIKEQCLNLV